MAGSGYLIGEKISRQHLERRRKMACNGAVGLKKEAEEESR